MAVLVTAATNLAQNPKPASLSYIQATGGASSPLLVYDRSYSGDTSAKISFNGVGQNFRWDSNGASDFGGVTTGVAQTFRARVRALSLTGASLGTVMVIFYTDATTAQNTQINYNIGPSDKWSIIDAGEITSNPAKTISFISVFVFATDADPMTIYFGGYDLRADQTLDSFVVGDGQRSSWAGTANDSISHRESYEMNVTVSRGAQFRYSVKYYVVDRRKVIIDDITPYVMGAPSISVDTLAEATKSTLSISLSRNDIVLPFRDMWISPRMTIEHSDGTIEGGDGPEGMLGIYSVEPASERYEAMGNSFNYTGYDLLWVLQQETLQPTPGSTTIYAPEGASYLIPDYGYPFRELLRQVFADGGFTEANQMLVLPNPVPAVLNQFPWGAEVGTSRLDFLTKTCDAMAWRRPWITLQGQATTEPLQDLALVEPDVTFTSGDNSDVRWPFEVDPEPENMANRIRVFAKYFGYNQIISAIVENSDPAHPFSTVALGYRDPVTGVVTKRYIDAPSLDKVVLRAHAEAVTYGQAELAKFGMLPYTVRMRTRAMIRQLNEVYSLNISDSLGYDIPNGQGKYWCVGWQLTLGAPWEMTHNLRRLIPVFETAHHGPDPEHWVWVPMFTQTDVQDIQKQIRALREGKENIKQLNQIKQLEKRLRQIKQAIAAGKMKLVRA